MSDRFRRRGQDEYHHAYMMKLPLGIAWPRAISTVLSRCIKGLAGIFARCDSRAADLLVREADPRTAVELLPEWERAFGLPDPCYEAPQTIGERQRHLVLRMTLLGAQDRQFFIDVAKFLGYDISISEYRPFMVGIDRVGDNRAILEPGVFGPWPAQIGHPQMRFVWTVHVYRIRLTWFRASKGQAGIDPHLRISLADDLECVLRRWRPAHTHILFDYSGVTPGDSMAGTP